MFTEALSINTKTWMQSHHPSIGQWINKLWYTQTIAHYSALKGNELPSHKNSCKKVKCLLLSKRGQPKKAIYYMISTI